MTVKAVLMDIGVLGAVAAIAFGGGLLRGESWGLARGNDAIFVAQRNAKTAQDNARTIAGTLTGLKAKLASLQQDYAHLQQVADQAIRDRDAAQAARDKAAAQRITAERKTAHEDPDCASLRRLPVCPQLARQLLGQPTQAAAADAHPGAAGH